MSFAIIRSKDFDWILLFPFLIKLSLSAANPILIKLGLDILAIMSVVFIKSID